MEAYVCSTSVTAEALRALDHCQGNDLQ